MEGNQVVGEDELQAPTGSGKLFKSKLSNSQGFHLKQSTYWLVDWFGFITFFTLLFKCDNLSGIWFSLVRISYLSIFYSRHTRERRVVAMETKIYSF